MNRLKRWLTFSAAWLFCLGLHAVALAQEEAPVEDEGAKGYVLQYFLVVLFVALALMAVCRPARRAEALPQKK